MLRRVHVKGYKSLVDVELSLRKMDIGRAASADASLRNFVDSLRATFQSWK